MSKDRLNIGDMPSEYLAIYNVIYNAQAPITREKILLYLAKDKSYERRFNEIINKMIVDYGLPIGSSSREGYRGYYVVTNKEELNIAVQSLKSRINRISERKEALEQIIKDMED